MTGFATWGCAGVENPFARLGVKEDGGELRGFILYGEKPFGESWERGDVMVLE
jgi:hypothetical protein